MPFGNGQGLLGVVGFVDAKPSPLKPPHDGLTKFRIIIYHEQIDVLGSRHARSPT